MTWKQSSFASCCCEGNARSVTYAHRVVTHTTLAEGRRVAEVRGENKRETENCQACCCNYKLF